MFPTLSPLSPCYCRHHLWLYPTLLERWLDRPHPVVFENRIRSVQSRLSITWSVSFSDHLALLVYLYASVRLLASLICLIDSTDSRPMRAHKAIPPQHHNPGQASAFHNPWNPSWLRHALK